MTKINPKQILKDYNGEEIFHGKDEERAALDMKTALINALAYEDNELRMNPEQKIRSYELSLQLTKQAEVELKSDDVVFLKARLNKLYTPVVFGQVMQILEGEPTPVDKK